MLRTKAWSSSWRLANRKVLQQRTVLNTVRATAVRTYASQDNFVNTTNAAYIDEMYQAWQQDPSSVHASWNAYFKNMKDLKIPASQAFQAPPILLGSPQGTHEAPLSTLSGSNIDENVSVHLKVQLLCRAYQVRGHLKAHIDPLGISFGSNKNATIPKELTLDYYGFTERDLDREINLGPGILPRFARDGKKSMTLREIIEHMEKLYCTSYGIEYTHIPSKEKCEWLRERIEIPTPYQYTVDQKRQILDRLTWATSFESFLSTKFPNEKRFGLEGLEAVVPGIKTLIDRSVEMGVEDVVLGMAHRGRLNVLSNVVRKPNESIFSEFQGTTKKDVEGSGDVKYHLGMNYQRPTTSGKYVNLSLVANPSHLEAQDPVVLGRTRSILHAKNDLETKSKALAVLLHGDAAFAGQGVVYETMGFVNLPEYSTGGTIHIITNNQIGFTTDPRFSRSTPYPSDLAKAIDAPIFHVNANDVEAVTYIFGLAAEWRQTFHTDAIIDVVGWRKHGHNETDQPSFTQPLMYKQIAKTPSVIDVYTDKLLKEGSFSKSDIEEHKKWVWGIVSGEDVERGTFSQRHSVLHDQASEATYTPLKNLSDKQADFTIANSSLSEYGVMGFEYGYSLTSPENLIVWEAQFGDFANTAQVIIDQFIAGGEQKWKQRSGLVLSLPHGYDGQGPEHSSGRLERFLQMANEDPRYFPSPEKLQRQHQDCNYQVVYPTTPANLFHILRRQQHRQFRKPLVLFFSKQLLRHPLARSNLSEFTEGSFQWIIEDVEHGKAIGTKEETKKLVLMSGQVYTALHKKREQLGDKTTAFLKIEELHPFPFAQLRDTLNSYPNLEEIVWCQEEPLNMGSWNYVAPRLQTVLKETEQYKDNVVRYCGRSPSGAVAAGNKKLHLAEEEAFLKDVFNES
ncbi:2-oxoglutarate dehydrogenase, mitochondrial [Nakaseomyces glabratus]|uniref:2-oxoglutarate dehydrogenase, mitochondrial n=1 Tax=Candida glabrata TaxID=5478 RepID=A0A0W0D2T7_CANGB|nr:2-oxoglutarate dehydrogenase, mitochondrial [Nakaseomyces glabratus]